MNLSLFIVQFVVFDIDWKKILYLVFMTPQLEMERAMQMHMVSLLHARVKKFQQCASKNRSG